MSINLSDVQQIDARHLQRLLLSSSSSTILSFYHIWSSTSLLQLILKKTFKLYIVTLSSTKSQQYSNVQSSFVNRSVKCTQNRSETFRTTKLFFPPIKSNDVYCIDSDINSPQTFVWYATFFYLPPYQWRPTPPGGFLRAPINRGFSTNLHTDKNTVITFYDRWLRHMEVSERHASAWKIVNYDFFWVSDVFFGGCFCLYARRRRSLAISFDRIETG